MTLPRADAKGSVWNIVLSAVLGMVVAGLIAMWGVGQDIASIKAAVAGQIEVNRRLDESVRNLSAQMISVLGNLENLKDADVAQTGMAGRLKDEYDRDRQDRIAEVNDLRKRLEAIDKIIFPLERTLQNAVPATVGR